MTTTRHDPDPLSIAPETTIDEGVLESRWAWLVTVGRAVLTAAATLGTLASSPVGGADSPSAGTT
jgi:hypothetical protein